jgi:acylphosphatase
MDGRYYNVTVTGDVQDIGFRRFIESTANSYHVRGYVFNDPDGSVKMLCGGSVESVNELFHAIQTRAPPGISIGQFVKDEIVTDIDLNMPSEFLKLGTDEISDIGRKLDKGVKLLEALPDIKESVSMLPGIMESVSMLPDIKESVSMLPGIKIGIDAMNTKFDAFTDEQRTFNQKMGSHTKRLDGYIEEQREHNKRFDGYIEEQRGYNRRLDGYIEEQREHNKRFDGYIEEQRGYNRRLDGYIEEQREQNKLMGAHNLRLEQILQKLVEK